MSESWAVAVKFIKQFEDQIEIFLSSQFSPHEGNRESEVVKQIREIVEAHYPTLRSRWSWRIEKILSDHILIHLSNKVIIESSPLPVVWSRDKNTIWALNSLDGFIQIVEDEKLNLINNLQDILAIFWFFQTEKRFLENSSVLQTPTLGIISDKLPLLPKYLKIIGPLVYSDNGEQQQAKFWTIDISSGDLEGWLFIQNEAKFQVQPWIIERHFVKTFMRK